MLMMIWIFNGQHQRLTFPFPSLDTVAARVSNRQRVSRSSFTSTAYVDIHDIDID